MKIRNLLLALLACASLVCAQEEAESETAAAPAASSSGSASASGAHTLGVGYYGMIAGGIPGVGVVYAMSPSMALQLAAGFAYDSDSDADWSTTTIGFAIHAVLPLLDFGPVTGSFAPGLQFGLPTGDVANKKIALVAKLPFRIGWNIVDRLTLSADVGVDVAWQKPRTSISTTGDLLGGVGLTLWL
ncbi:MAG: hypothetical protein J6Y56_05685 [Fibrobacterales bacterium]|nr:hypothetical protein [Fibrobacterales bacterium]